MHLRQYEANCIWWFNQLFVSQSVGWLATFTKKRANNSREKLTKYPVDLSRDLFVCHCLTMAACAQRDEEEPLKHKLSLKQNMQRWIYGSATELPLITGALNSC